MGFFSTLTDDFFFQVPQFMFIFAMTPDSENSVYLVRLQNYHMGTMPSVQRT